MKQSRDGHVYVLECGGFYKIGRTKNIRGITHRYKTENPFPIQRVCQWKTNNTHKLESDLHELFAEAWHRGEWFTLCANLDFFRMKLERSEWVVRKERMLELLDTLEEKISERVYGL